MNVYEGYDCVTSKPDIDDIFIAHYGVKGMKWHKHLKSKLDLLKTKLNRKRLGLEADEVTDMYGKEKTIRRDNGRANSLSLPSGNYHTEDQRNSRRGNSAETFMGVKVNPSGFNQAPLRERFYNRETHKMQNSIKEKIDYGPGISEGRKRAGINSRGTDKWEPKTKEERAAYTKVYKRKKKK